jgi:sugar phosphate isomerase/epimerase
MHRIYIIPDRTNISESLRLAETYNACFEYQDFFLPHVLDDEQTKNEWISFYRALPRDRSQDMLHGAFLDVTVHSADKYIRMVSEHRIRQSLDIARALQIRGAVFHTNTIPNFKTGSYIQNWIDTNVAFWTKIREDYPELEIVIENMFDQDPDALHELAVRMEHDEKWGVCFDYAHANVFGGNIRPWVEKLLPYTRHMHINDNDFREDLHQSVGDGSIDWKQFDKEMRARRPDASILIETAGIEQQRKSLEFMKREKIYPFG